MLVACPPVLTTKTNLQTLQMSPRRGEVGKPTSAGEPLLYIVLLTLLMTLPWSEWSQYSYRLPAWEESRIEADLGPSWAQAPPIQQAPFRTHSSAVSLSSFQMLQPLLWAQPPLPGCSPRGAARSPRSRKDGPRAGYRESCKLEWVCCWWRGAKYFIFIK